MRMYKTINRYMLYVYCSRIILFESVKYPVLAEFYYHHGKTGHCEPRPFYYHHGKTGHCEPRPFFNHHGKTGHCEPRPFVSVDLNL